MFGGFCPLPIPLTPGATTGWSAQQHARSTFDRVAAFRTAPLARVTCTMSGGGATLTAYSGQNGVGTSSAFAPTVTRTGAGVATVEWSGVYETDEGDFRPWHLVHAKVTPHGTAARFHTVEIDGNKRKVTVRFWDTAGLTAADCGFTLKVSGRWRAVPRIGDYGGDPQKQNTTTEKTPYAWAHYQAFTSALPDGLTRGRTGELHAKKLALARCKAGVDRAIQRERNNANPALADESLWEWAQVQGINVRPQDERWQVRSRCAAKLKALVGPNRTRIEQAITDLLGDYLQQIVWYQDNDLSSPPDYTYWPGINPGPTDWDTGGGTWSSRRAHLTVVVKNLSTLDDDEREYLFNTQLFQLLDRMLPDVMTFNWGTAGPFLIGISRIGIDSL